MPKNPYDFVPFEGNPPSPSFDGVPLPDLSKMHGYTGHIEFELTTLTPLVINERPPAKGNLMGKFARRGNQPVIPATSLKGMLRSVHEVVTNSRLGIVTINNFQNASESKLKAYEDRIPARYRPSPKDTDLTWSEVLFGSVPGEEEHGSNQQDADVAKRQGCAGRLFFSDIDVSLAHNPMQIAPPQGGPKPLHESFYFYNGNALGRKFYYHQNNYVEVCEEYKRRFQVQRNAGSLATVEYVPANETVTGSLRFINLSEAELQFLVYTLVLETDLAHKLGYGKPLGLGSVRISIMCLEVEPAASTPSRFLTYGEQVTEDWTSRVAALQDAARTAWKARPQGQESYAAFRAITRWPQTENFVYPDFNDFFRPEKDALRQTTLWEYQGRANPYPGQRVARPDPPVSLQTSSVLIQDTKQQSSVPQRYQGMLGIGGQGGYAVFDGDEELPVYTAGASGKLIKKQMKHLQGGKRIPVSYRREEGEDGAIAADLREVQS